MEIKEIRTALEMSQPEFAAALGVTQRTITRWENTNTRPKAGAITRELAKLEKKALAKKADK